MNNTFSINLIIGECDVLFNTLVIFIIMDYITGLLKSLYNQKLNSSTGAKGIIKKFGYIFIVILSGLIDNLLNYTSNIRDIIIYMFIINESISIIENWSKMGIKIPEILKDRFGIQKHKKRKK